jgi:hypothetical protein
MANEKEQPGLTDQESITPGDDEKVTLSQEDLDFVSGGVYKGWIVPVSNP